MPTSPVSVYCAPNEYTEYAIPRFSRISWKSRDEAEPPRIESRIDAANRRRSERAMPGAPAQTWYCSVFFFANASPGGGDFTSGRRTRGPPAGGPAPGLRARAGPLPLLLLAVSAAAAD